jgi:Domain of unknown function (DUF4269)
MFSSITYLINGNEKQKAAFNTLTKLNIMNNLKEFTPILCGTIPIGIDIEGSDLDIIMEVHDFNSFEEIIKSLYGSQNQFRILHSKVREVPVITANFQFNGFELELFGQATPVKIQNAYLHMIIEYLILERDPNLKVKVVNLKKQGFKTEPAFCRLLGLNGDPYEALIEYGNKIGLKEVIHKLY